MKTYSVKEIFLSCKRRPRRAAFGVLPRGCNLWSGREGPDSAICDFCDNGLVGVDGPGAAGSYAGDLAAAIVRPGSVRASPPDPPLFVFTGGSS